MLFDYGMQPIFPWSPIVWQFVLLAFCGVISLGEAEAFDGYCYNNIFADIVLNNGKPEGIYAYVDLFSWNGFTMVWIVQFFMNLFTEFTFNTLIGVGLAIVYYIVAPTTPLC